MRVDIGELGLKDAYKFYKAKYPKGHKYYCTYQTYAKICKAYNKEISRRMIEEGETIQLPYRLSIMRIAKYQTHGLTIKQSHRLKELTNNLDKSKSEEEEYKRLKSIKGRLAVDWETYNKTGQWTYHLNEHSDGFQAFFYWQKIKVVVKNKRYYRFIPCRANARRLSKLMKAKDAHKLYPETQRITRKFKSK